jgi:hypothetical protein
MKYLQKGYKNMVVKNQKEIKSKYLHIRNNIIIKVQITD